MPDGILNKLPGTDITWLGNRKGSPGYALSVCPCMDVDRLFRHDFTCPYLQSISSDILEAADIDGASGGEIQTDYPAHAGACHDH